MNYSAIVFYHDEKIDVSKKFGYCVEQKKFLTIAYWCVLYLYDYCIVAMDDEFDVNSKILLMINGESYSIWNRRKEWLEKMNDQELVIKELRFVSFVLRKHTKCEDPWTHRKWCVKKLIEYKNKGYDIIKEELDVCLEMCVRYKRNYYGWKYRLFVIELFLPSVDLILDDLKTVNSWLQTNISDNSGWNHIRFLMNNLYELDKDVFISELCYQFIFNQFLSLIFLNSESLWYHRRYLWKMKEKENDKKISEVFHKNLDRFKLKDHKLIDAERYPFNFPNLTNEVLLVNTYLKENSECFYPSSYLNWIIMFSSSLPLSKKKLKNIFDSHNKKLRERINHTLLWKRLRFKRNKDNKNNNTNTNV